MLYDPKWEKPEVKADPLTLTALIAWLESKPASETYYFADTCGCLAAQYNASIGRKYEAVYIGDHHRGFDCVIENIAIGEGVDEGWTFGAALERARALHLAND